MMIPNNVLQMLGGNAQQTLQELQRNPMQILRKRGFNIPDNVNVNDPNSIIQYLMNSGQVTQSRYNQARQFLSQFKK